jgi:hypothetical protein
MHQTNERETLDHAIDALHRETGVTARVVELEPYMHDRRCDAVIDIAGNRLFAEIKNWAQHGNIGAIINQIKAMPGPGILVADFVNPQMADKLKGHDVQFIDTVGNAYLRGQGLYVLVKGNRRPTATLTAKKPKGRAFSNTGLKVVYAFLCDPTLVNAPYRDIAEIADVAVGTVGWVLNDLKANGYVRQQRREKDRYLTKKRQLLDRWVETYPEKLKPKQKLGTFDADEPGWWTTIDLKEFHAYWGGETAAALLTKHLRPEIATIYVDQEKWTDIVIAARLRKKDQTEHAENPVQIYRAFWRKPEDQTGIVHPILVYADLIATAEPRNIETAQIIFKEFLSGHFGED